jgi:hypothetical protein
MAKGVDIEKSNRESGGNNNAIYPKNGYMQTSN